VQRRYYAIILLLTLVGLLATALFGLVQTPEEVLGALALIGTFCTLAIYNFPHNRQLRLHREMKFVLEEIRFIDSEIANLEISKWRIKAEYPIGRSQALPQISWYQAWNHKERIRELKARKPERVERLFALVMNSKIPLTID
jgi:hypothetical protein